MDGNEAQNASRAARGRPSAAGSPQRRSAVGADAAPRRQRV